MKLTPNPRPFRYDLGLSGENHARQFLKKSGYEILETNFRCPLGEIDLIARENQRLIFIEVKTRRSDRAGTPEESVHVIKQKKIIRVAQWYLKAKKLTNVPIRFDVIAIDLNPQQGFQLRHIPGAFSVPDEEI